VIKVCASIYGHPASAQINGPQEIPDPPDRSTFNGGGGSDMMVKECVQNNG
jgi:hypothetical protein